MIYKHWKFYKFHVVVLFYVQDSTIVIEDSESTDADVIAQPEADNFEIDDQLIRVRHPRAMTGCQS